MGFTLAYILNDKLYLNITNRCTNRCSFCIRKSKSGIGYDLWLDREPSAEEVLAQVEKSGIFSDIVFCGYGEPLLRPDIVAEVSKELKKKYNPNIWINTNGLAQKYLGQNFLPDLAGLVDIISISLNAHDAQTYFNLCRPSIGIEAHNAVLEFAEESTKYIPRVILSVVDIPEVNLDLCKKIAEKLGTELRIRKLIP